MREPGERVHPKQLLARLRHEREAQGLTVEWVAEKVGITKQSISDFETDTTGRKRPSDDTIRKWVRALGQPDEWAANWELWRTAEQMVRQGKVRLREKMQVSEDSLIESIYLQLRGARD
ncbi:MAG TPA: helix-turn-helix transcriptional regulator [Candidatus Limnocylindria bacterium]|nr:helix-turn-helix transcriptional regulator [Candidatus Limnocylindria bacterium]